MGRECLAPAKPLPQPSPAARERGFCGLMRGLLGVVALLALAWALSENRRRIPWRTVVAGIALQWALALLLFHFPPANALILLLNDGATALQNATQAGTSFVFGYLPARRCHLPRRIPVPASCWHSRRCRWC